MRLKAILFSVVCCAVMFAPGGGMIHAQSITVTSPKAGDTWFIGQTHNITWTRTGEMSETVAIRLWDEAAQNWVMNIVNDTANNGIYPWHIPSDVSPGNYTIRVRAGFIDDDIYGHSDAFRITVTMTRPDIERKPDPSLVRFLPDLVVEQGGVTPKNPDQGDKVRFEALIRNKGGVPSKSAFDALIKVTGPKGFKPIEKTFRVKPLERDETTKIFLDYLCSHWGIVRVQVKLDLKNEIKESDKDNNERIFHHGVDPLPDLVVCMQSPTSIRVLYTKKVGVRVVNRGTGRSPASRLRWYVRQNDVVWRDVPPLDPGQGEVFYRDIKFPTRGSKIMRATIDPENQIKELNPDNNTVEGAAVAFLPHEFDSTGLKTWVCSDGGK